MKVGDRIKETRIKKDISQTELADKCGVSKQTLYKYENNIVTNIPLPTITKIAKSLNVSEAFLMGWEVPGEIIETADMDADLIMLEKRIKEYAIKLSKLSEDDRKDIMKMIDRFGK